MTTQFRSLFRVLAALAAALLASPLMGQVPFPVDLTQSGYSVKLVTTTTNGRLYTVLASDLAAMLGQPSEGTVRNWITNGMVGLSNQGQSVRYLPEPDGSQFYFFAEMLRNNYTDSNYYWLRAGTNVVPPAANGQAPAPVSAGSYLASVLVEQDLTAQLTLTTNIDEDYWLWRQLLADSGPNRTYSPPFPAIDQLETNSGLTANLGLRVFGVSATTNTVIALINGVKIGQTNWFGRVPFRVNFPFDPALLGNGATNVLRLTATNAVGTTGSSWYLNNFTIAWPRKFVSNGGSLDFGASNQTVTVTGFTNQSLRVVDVTDSLHPVWITNNTVPEVSSPWSVSFTTPVSSQRQVALVPGGTARLGTNNLVVVNDTPLLDPAQPKQCLYLAPFVLTNATATLAARRQAQGLETAVIPIESVFDQYGFGVRSPVAIQAFLRAGVAAWPNQLAYVTLVGNGTYDYRGRLGTWPNLIPPLLTGYAVGVQMGMAPSDSLLADTDNDRQMNLAIARIPVTNSVQLSNVVLKIIAYENTPTVSPPRALELADDPGDFSAGNFPADMKAVDNLLTNKFVTTYFQGTNSTSLGTVRQNLTNALNGGQDLFFYLGHGIISALGSASYLTSADVSLWLTNSARLPVVVAATCVVGDFSPPQTVNLCYSSAWIMNPTQGASAAIAASAPSWNSDASQLTTRLAALLGANSRARLGDSFRVGMSQHNALDYIIGNPWIYNLLGDAALRVNIPVDSPANLVPPAVTLSSPTAIPVRAPATLNFTTSATDADGIVVEVDLYQNGALVAQNRTLPFPFTLTNVAPGIHQFYAVAYDDTGLTATSGLQQVTVSVPVGDIVWLDNGAGTGATNSNNGIRDPGEGGLDGVVLALWTPGADGVIGGSDDSLVGLTTSSNGGAYGFNFTLPAGKYYVAITNPPSSYSKASSPFVAGNNGNKGTQTNIGGPVFGPVFTLNATNAETTMDFGFITPQPTLPTVVDFAGSWQANEVRLDWVTRSEFWTMGYNLYLSGPGGALKLVNSLLIPAVGGLYGDTYVFYDSSPEPHGVRQYLMEEVTFDGSNWFGPISVAVPDVAVATSLRMQTEGFQIGFQGLPGLTYRVEATESLEPPSWLPAGSVSANALGSFSFLDAAARTQPNQFYRAVWP